MRKQLHEIHKSGQWHEQTAPLAEFLLELFVNFCHLNILPIQVCLHYCYLKDRHNNSIIIKCLLFETLVRSRTVRLFLLSGTDIQDSTPD